MVVSRRALREYRPDAMELLPVGYVVDATYRVLSTISASDRAQIYAAVHVRFPDVPVVLKVAAVERAADFERDTVALASMTSPCVARVHDAGWLPDGRPYRVAERLAGPTLRQALAQSTFSERRAIELVVALAAAAHEARDNGSGPCDLSIDNLMFADGVDGRLCMLRLLVPDGRGPDLAADEEALRVLRTTLEHGLPAAGRAAPTMAWKPPSDLRELRKALELAGAPHTPEPSDPGARIERWEVVKRISETLRATVYEVKSQSGVSGILKVAGPNADHAFFTRHADLLARVQSKHVVRVLDFGAHEGTPFMVMEPLSRTQRARLESEAPLSVDAAMQTIDELLWGAEAIHKAYGSPSDFSLEHCYQATGHPSFAVLTHAMVQVRSFGMKARPTEGEYADAWSAAVALYELVAGRLPFPTTKHSLAKAWMGMPTPLGARRSDVPAEISDLVHAILTGTRMKTADLRRELTRIRSTPAAMRTSAPPAMKLGSEAPARHSVDPPTANAPTLLAGGGAVPPASAVWEMGISPSRCPIDVVSVAAFARDGREILAVGRDAVARYRTGQWTVAPAREVAANVVALTQMDREAWLALTRSGALLRLGPTGGFVPWGVALDRYAFRAAIPDGTPTSDDGAPERFVLVGGTKDGARAVIATLAGESITIVTDALDLPPLHAATRLPDGSLLVLADGGVIAVVRDGKLLEAARPCEAELFGALVVGGEAVVVGAAAWAFTVTTSPLTARLEPVETLSDLCCLTSDGTHAWAGSSKGRILRRVEGRWKRMNPPFAGDPPIVAIHASPERVRALTSDGRVVLGQPLRPPAHV